MRWPKDNQDALIAFYGNPGSRGFGANLVKVVPPFAMYYAGKRVPYLSFHRLAAPALLRALNTIWNYYGRDQHVIDKLGISIFSGTYNPRMVRGSATKWSNHAYGAAIDLDAAHNGFNTGHGHMSLVVVSAFKAEGATWGGDYQHRTDPMHLEFCDRGEPQRSFAQWLAFYKIPPQPTARPATAFAEPAPAGGDDEPDEPQVAQPSLPAQEPETEEPDAPASADEGAILPETPADAPKTGITEGAQVAGGLTVAGIGSQIWNGLATAPQSILEALVAEAQKPTFWIFIAIGGAALYIWWQRHAVKKGV